MKKAIMKIGQRIRATRQFDGNKAFVGMRGTIIGVIVMEVTQYNIEFDEKFGGHSCGSKGKDGHCWNMPASCFLPISGESSLEQAVEEAIWNLLHG